MITLISLLALIALIALIDLLVITALISQITHNTPIVSSCYVVAMLSYMEGELFD